MRRYRKLRVSWVDTVSHVCLGRNYRRLIGGRSDSLRAVKPVESPNSPLCIVPWPCGDFLANLPATSPRCVMPCGIERRTGRSLGPLPGADRPTRNSSRIRRNVDDRERRNKLAKRQEAEKQPDPARLGVSLSWDRCRVIGPNRGFRGPLLGHEVPLDRLRRGLARPATKTVAGPSMLFLPSPFPLSRFRFFLRFVRISTGRYSQNFLPLLQILLNRQQRFHTNSLNFLVMVAIIATTNRSRERESVILKRL